MVFTGGKPTRVLQGDFIGFYSGTGGGCRNLMRWSFYAIGEDQQLYFFDRGQYEKKDLTISIADEELIETYVAGSLTAHVAGMSHS